MALYGYRLADSPPYVGLDEAHFANHAGSLATSGRDLNGNRLPVFISLEDPLGDRPVLAWGATWYHPYGFYLIAAALTVLPVSEWAIRIPFALVGVVTMLLTYAAARRWLGSRVVAAGAASLLAMTPAFFILSRLALDYLLPLPFTLAWLLGLDSLLLGAGRRVAILTGLALAAGCLSYVSSWLMMPAYLAITIGVLLHNGESRLVRPLLGGFAVPLAGLGTWVVMHPAMPANILAQYQAGEARRSVITAVLSGNGVAAALRDALSAYWSYFDPSFLFVAGGSSRLVSTGTIGVWPLGVAVLLLIGVYRTLTPPSTRSVVLLAGLLLAPLPAALKGEPFAIQRAVALLPFGVLLAADGLRSLPGFRTAPRIALLVVTVTIPLQFATFVVQYFGEYRAQAARALDPTAFRDTAAVLLQSANEGEVPVVALAAPLYDVSAKWRFYCTKAGRTDLLPRTRYFNGRLIELGDLPAGALAVVQTAGAEATDGWRLVAAPQSVFGGTPLTIFQRQ